MLLAEADVELGSSTLAVLLVELGCASVVGAVVTSTLVVCEGFSETDVEETTSSVGEAEGVVTLVVEVGRFAGQARPPVRRRPPTTVREKRIFKDKKRAKRREM